MVLVLPDPVARLKTAKGQARAQWSRDRRLVRYAQGAQGVPYTPSSATAEYRQLQRRCILNVTRLACEALAAGLRVGGLTPSDAAVAPDADDAAAAAALEQAAEQAAGWDYWQRAGLDAGQTLATYRATVLGYTNVLAWVSDVDGEQLVEARSVNPLASWGQFLDVDDAHPTVFIRRLGGAAGLASGAARWEVLSHDDTGGYRAVVDETANAVTELWRHELDHVPVTRLVGARDLEGEPEGRVVPLRDAQDRVNETVFALLMAQAYQSFRQRWAVGVTELNVSPAVDRVWTTAAGKETAQFGEFQAADLSNLVGAVTSALSGFAAVATLPPQNVLGLPSNVSADGLAAAEQAHSRMRDQWQRNMGEGWETLVRDLGDLAGDDAVAADHASQVRWEPTEARSFATVVDGLVKLTAGERPILPVEVALDLVPGLSTQDRSRARRLLRVQAPSALATLAGQAAAAALPDPATLLGL